MTAVELLILALAIPGAVVALRDVCARHALPHDAASARGGHGNGAGTRRRPALTDTVELAISVRLQIARAREGLDRLVDVEPPVDPSMSTERAHADAS